MADEHSRSISRAWLKKLQKYGNALSAALPNMGGGGGQAPRYLYYNVWESVIMYAAPIWAAKTLKGANQAA
ncbi:hypothetical protein WH47_00855 [Habropoda laboriosa]|uniref:Uncharacterized protein n=1 Tax=Habropoda laboriosa TaxID=597456 RepID=A0A0L7QJZ5_9HYME|nr:hypothetical protein WH47_00855 [Habropoda laboriosa]